MAPTGLPEIFEAKDVRDVQDSINDLNQTIMIASFGFLTFFLLRLIHRLIVKRRIVLIVRDVYIKKKHAKKGRANTNGKIPTMSTSSLNKMHVDVHQMKDKSLPQKNHYKISEFLERASKCKIDKREKDVMLPEQQTQEFHVNLKMSSNDIENFYLPNRNLLHNIGTTVDNKKVLSPGNIDMERVSMDTSNNRGQKFMESNWYGYPDNHLQTFLGEQVAKGKN